MQDIGVVQQDSTVRIMFVTRNASGAATAPSDPFENADVEIYKDGSATQRASDAGVTMTSPFDAVTGLHLVQIDLSDNTDAGFWAAGSNYHVTIQPNETVDGQTVVEVLAEFTIETDSQKAVRTFNSAAFITDTVVTVTSNTTTAVNLTDFLDAQAPDNSTTGELWLWQDSTGELEYFRVQSMASLVATVEAWPQGGALSDVVASGDRLWRVAAHAPAPVKIKHDDALGFKVVTTTNNNTSTGEVNFSDYLGANENTLVGSIWMYYEPTGSFVTMFRVVNFTSPMATCQTLPSNNPFSTSIAAGGYLISMGHSFANVRQINAVNLVGDGDAVPFDVQ
jgi:hypothetical protein